MKACICEIKEGKVELASDTYTSVFLKKDKYGLSICAYGEEELEWKPDFCPLCGRRNRKDLHVK